MSDTVHCDTHGETPQAFVCTHLVGVATGLGFNHESPTDESPFPDAWCDNCELIRAAHGSWDQTPDDLITIRLLCTACYERARIRNERPTVALADLANLRWKCSTCDEWHDGPCLDFGYDSPFYWREELADDERMAGDRRASFLDTELCAIEDEQFFVRGIIHLPILGTGESFRWGV